MQKIKDKHIFIIYIAAFFLIAASMALFQPLADTPPMFGNPPDEHARYLIPQYICEHGRIPTGFEEEVRIPSYGFSYGLYNVFPYIVQGYVMRFVSLFTGSELMLLYAARFVNVITGTLMAAVVYLLARRLFADRRFRWLFCFAVMYLPENLFLHTYVNSDSMCLLSTAMMVYALVSAYREGFSRANSLWLSGGIILCALSYYNAYGYILSSILLFLAYFIRKEDGRLRYDWKEMLKKGVFIGVIVLAGISWWFIRSYILFDGDILGLATREKMASQYAIDAVNPDALSTYQSKGYSILQMMKEEQFMTGAFITFVAAFGSLSIVGNIWMYRAFKLFFIVGLAACVLLRRKRGGCNGGNTAPSGGPVLETPSAAKRLFFHINMIFCMAMPLILLIHYAYTMDFQNQGRYLLPAVVPLMYYAVAGLQKLCALKWIPRWLANAGVAAGIVLFFGSTLWMVYYCAFPIYLDTGVVLH